MGRDVANGGCITDGAGCGSIVFYAHWEDENIEERTAITTDEARQLRDAAKLGPAAFDAAAALIAAWYGLPTLSTANRASQREACRRGWLRIAEI